VGNTRVIQGEACRVRAQMLPPPHLALIAPFGDLGRYIEIDNRMNRVWSLVFAIN